jgi:hypothetical protein
VSITRRTFGVGVMSAIACSAAGEWGEAFADQNLASKRPFFSMLLPDEYDAADVAFQCFAFDEVGNKIYGQFSTRGDPQMSLVAQYELVPWGSGNPVSIQPPTEAVGHQGLAIEAAPGGQWMWAAGPGHSDSAVRFKFTPDGAPETTAYRLFDDRYAKAAITTAISHDGRLLIAASRKKQHGGSANTIRVFELKDVLASPDRDTASLFRYEWQIPTPKGIPVQGLACADDRVFISYGTAKATEAKPILSFSVDGKLQSETHDITVGRADIPPRWSYEPEGLCFGRIPGRSRPSLLIGITTGRAEVGRTRQIYVLDL